MDISSKLSFLENREFTSSESEDYMGRTYKGITTSLDIRTKRSNRKQNERFSVTGITNKDFRKLLKKFKISPYLGYKSKQVHNEPTEA